MTTDMTDQKEAAWQAMLAGEEATAEADPANPVEVIPDTYSQVGDIVGRPSEESPGALRITDLRFRGYTQVWDTKTGDMSLQPWWLLWQTMRKKHEDGAPRFTRTDPKIPPSYGDDLACPLNPESTENEFYRGKGFRSCKKRHIPHEDALWRHVRHSHKRAWDMRQTETANRERREDRELQQRILDAQVSLAEAMKGRLVPEDLAKEATQIVAQAQEQPATDLQTSGGATVYCPKCNKAFTREDKDHAEASLRSHGWHCGDKQ